MKRILSILLVIMITASVFFYIGRKTAPEINTLHYITYDDLASVIEEEDLFVLYIGRSSCHFCAVVDGSLHKFLTYNVPIYVLNLEDYKDDNETYEQIKTDLGFWYMPCFKAYKNGTEIAHMNSPLSDHYYDDDVTDHQELRKEMEEKIDAFFCGITGEGELVNEEPTSSTVEATPAGEVVHVNP